jgi:hypothetical protein
LLQMSSVSQVNRDSGLCSELRGTDNATRLPFFAELLKKTGVPLCVQPRPSFRRLLKACHTLFLPTTTSVALSRRTRVRGFVAGPYSDVASVKLFQQVWIAGPDAFRAMTHSSAAWWREEVQRRVLSYLGRSPDKSTRGSQSFQALDGIAPGDEAAMRKLDNVRPVLPFRGPLLRTD